VLSKGAFPMDHPLHMGVHMGALSPGPIRKRVTEAGLVLSLGTMLTDMELGGRGQAIDRTRFVWAVDNRVHVSLHTYDDVTLRDFVHALLRAPLRRRREKVRYADNLSGTRRRRAAPVRVVDLLREVNDFLRDKRRYLVVAESGDMLFAGLDVRVPGSSAYLAQGYYASMGFGVPGAIGAQIAKGLRPLLLCGDGAFQMTGPEIAQAPRHGCNPIVLVINNGGWEIFRPVAERPDLLAIPAWPYAELARHWGGVGFKVDSVPALREALQAADRCKSFVIIEAIVAPQDHSPVSRKYIAGAARSTRGTRVPRET
jgi:TPP-dependent 2-oxoacid decarboxylase